MAEPRTLLTGLAMGESPRWHDDQFWVCDWVAQEVIRVDAAGQPEVVLNVASLPFSIDWLADGRMVIVSSNDRRLVAREPDGALTTYAELGGICDRPWNEIVVDGRGNTYVNSINFDMMAGESPKPGIVALVAPDGTSRQVADGLLFPNGMAVTPDNSTLIVAESYAHRLTAFDIAADGSLSNRRVWSDLPEAFPDGICLDAEGAIWYADVPNKHCVRVREGGAVLESIDLDRGCFACMLGGADRRTLFLVAAEWGGSDNWGTADPPRTGQVLTVQASVAGVGWP
jgi:sugar lactone lactonase YvrE